MLKITMKIIMQIIRYTFPMVTSPFLMAKDTDGPTVWFGGPRNKYLPEITHTILDKNLFQSSKFLDRKKIRE